MKYDIEYIEKIAKIVTDNKLSELTLKEGEETITIKNERHYEDNSRAVSIPISPMVANPTDLPKSEEKPKAEKRRANAITSPMVGAFYAAPAPGAKPFVKVGDTVSTGQVVCIVEAMKLMNEIESEVSGRVVEICVEDGQSVEYGQVLMYVE